jgi:acetyl esterase
MPLDPQVQTLLDQIAMLEGPKLEDLPVAEARVVYATFKQMVPAVEAARTADFTVGPATVRAHYPMGAPDDAVLPVVVWFHEGGFTVGDLSTSDSTAAELANSSGCVVVNVDYPLAPEHPFPEPLDAAFAAVEWVADHAGSDLGVDPARLAVGGDSAGGNLAAAICVMARDRGGPSIRFQLLAYPCLDARMSYPSIRENGEGYLLGASTLRWFWDQYIGDADPEDPRLSPLYEPDLAGLPPALVITAEFDPLRDEGEAYAERLRQAGGIASASRYDGMVHSLLSMAQVWEGGRKAMDECAQALRAAL